MYKSFCFFLVFVLIGIFGCSCNCRYYIEKDKNGKKHLLREYKTTELQDKHYSKSEIKAEYKPRMFSIDTACLSRTDSTVECDSIAIRILSDSRQYADVFTKGLISCKMLNDAYPDDRLLILDIKTGKEIVQPTQRSVYVHSVIPLTFIRTSQNRRLFQFRITAYTFYFELTNDKANRKTKINEFIQGARLTWFYRSGRVEI